LVVAASDIAGSRAFVWAVCQHESVSTTNEVPATREALAGHLDRLGVRSDCYHLYGAHLDDAFVMDHRPTGWVVFYSERGGEWSVATHDREAGACADLLARVVREDHCFFELVAGPAPAEAADAEWAAWLQSHGIGADGLDPRDWKTDDVPWVPGPYWRRYFVRIKAFRDRQSSTE
tara:strand:+ start:9425 stop:9952 length:528 start_codon:yes stop_codon:yes gene_type:complete